MVKIIAEAGVNHEGSLERAFDLLEAAIAAKADMFKLQYYEKGFRGKNRELPWLTPKEMKNIDIWCQETTLEFLVTPHDIWALNFISQELNHKTVKIGSGGRHLIEPAKKLGFKVIVSLGMATNQEVNHIVDELLDGEDKILHCVSAYPTKPEDAQLDYLKVLLEGYYSSMVGYSDHTIGMTVPLAAVAMGASIVEKHLVLEQGIHGKQDTLVGLLPKEFHLFVRRARIIKAAIKPCVRTITKGELETMKWIKERDSHQAS